MDEEKFEELVPRWFVLEESKEVIEVLVYELLISLLKDSVEVANELV